MKYAKAQVMKSGKLIFESTDPLACQVFNFLKIAESPDDVPAWFFGVLKSVIPKNVFSFVLSDFFKAAMQSIEEGKKDRQKRLNTANMAFLSNERRLISEISAAKGKKDTKRVGKLRKELHLLQQKRSTELDGWMASMERIIKEVAKEEVLYKVQVENMAKKISVFEFKKMIYESL